MRGLILSILVLTLSLVILSGCSGIGLLNAVTPDRQQIPDRDLAYGENPRQRLDIYRTTRQSRGTVIFFYGGGWEGGSKKDFQFVVSTFTARGFDVVLPDYRVFPEVVFPAFVEDAAEAVAWIGENGEEHGLNLENIFLAGHSAGAHLAAMLHFDERYLNQRGFDPSRLKGSIGLSGPYDFLPLSSERLKEIFPVALRPASQPVNYVDGSEPPILLVHGTDDPTAWPRNTIRLTAKIEEKGGEVTTHYLEGAGHRRTALALSSTFRFLAPVGDYIGDFLDANT